MEVVCITGLLTAAPNDWSPKRCDHPLPVHAELEATGEARCELALSVQDTAGQTVLRHAGEVALTAGLNRARTVLPAHLLAPGRYSLLLEAASARFRSRRLLDAWLPPDAGRDGATGGAELWEVRPGPLERPAILHHVEQVRMRRPDGSEPLAFRGDEPVQVIARLNLEGLPPGPLARVQSFALDGTLALGTNTARFGLDLGRGGRRELVLSFERLNLTPGRYLTTVGLWRDEAAPEPIEALHGYHELWVEG